METKSKKSLFVLLFLVAFLLPGLLVTPNFALGGKVVELPDINAPLSMCTQSDRLYICEVEGISIISLKDFRTMKTFGKKGEGPGEWARFPNLTVHPDFLLVNTDNKVMLFSPDGELIKELKHGTRIGDFYPIGKNFAASHFEYEKNKITKNVISLYDSNLQLIKKICDQSPSGSVNPRDGGVLMLYRPPQKVGIYRAYKDRLYVSDAKKGFYIGVFDANGNKLYEIKPDYEKIKVTESYKKKSLEEIKSLWSKRISQPKYKVVFHEYFPPPFMFYVNTGRIYVFTWKEKNNTRELMVMDVKGNLQKKVFVPITDRDEAICFSGDQFYFLRENLDKETIELHIVEI
jgi:hypothetical protein